MKCRLREEPRKWTFSITSPWPVYVYTVQALFHSFFTQPEDPRNFGECLNSSPHHVEVTLLKISHNLMKKYFLPYFTPSSVKCEPCPDPVIPHDCVGVMFVAWPAVLVACLAQEEEEPRRTGVAPPLPSPSQAPRCTALCVAIKNMASGAFLRFNCPPTGAGHSLPSLTSLFWLSRSPFYAMPTASNHLHGTEVCAGDLFLRTFVCILLLLG